MPGREAIRQPRLPIFLVLSTAQQRFRPLQFCHNACQNGGAKEGQGHIQRQGSTWQIPGGGEFPQSDTHAIRRRS